MADVLASHVGRVVHFRLYGGATQITGAGNDKDAVRVPFNGRILSVFAQARAVGGTNPSFGAMVENGTTNILSAVMAVAAAVTPVEGTLVAAQKALTAGDYLRLDVDSAAGTNPTMNDLSCDIWVCRT